MEEFEPLTHDEYIEQRVFTPMRHVHQDINTISRFNEPARQYIGKSLLGLRCYSSPLTDRIDVSRRQGSLGVHQLRWGTSSGPPSRPAALRGGQERPRGR